jgi:hypothetical protein
MSDAAAPTAPQRSAGGAPSPADPRRSGRATGVIACALRQPGFLSCAALLAVFATGFQVWTAYANVQFVKQALPLCKPLDQLDQQKLYPYKFRSASQIKGEMLDSLGTDQYISWTLTDTTIKTASPEQLASLFVTYYTGKPDQVPHVPDVCYQAGGYLEKDASYHEFQVPALGINIPVKVLELERSKLFQRDSRIVFYTFYVNDRFVPERRDVMSVLANPLDRYAYFSKLEISFGTADETPPKEVALKSAERLLQVVVPLLVKEHWPSWKAAEDAARSAATRPAA